MQTSLSLLPHRWSDMAFPIEKPTDKKYLIAWFNACAYKVVRELEIQLLVAELPDCSQNAVNSVSKLFEKEAVARMRELTGEGMTGGFVPGYDLQVASNHAGQVVTGMFQFRFNNSDRILISIPMSILKKSDFPVQ